MVEMVEEDRLTGLHLTDRTKRALELLGDDRPLLRRVQGLTSAPVGTLRVLLGFKPGGRLVGGHSDFPIPQIV